MKISSSTSYLPVVLAIASLLACDDSETASTLTQGAETTGSGGDASSGSASGSAETTTSDSGSTTSAESTGTGTTAGPDGSSGSTASSSDGGTTGGSASGGGEGGLTRYCELYIACGGNYYADVDDCVERTADWYGICEGSMEALDAYGDCMADSVDCATWNPNADLPGSVGCGDEWNALQQARGDC